MTNTYRKPLPSDPESRWIRVFDLLPSRSAADEAIRGQLRIVSLDDNPFYEALSYAWGNPCLTRHVECGGGNLAVTTNCYDALMQLNSFKVVTLWVDSICINQSDEVEKSRQVTLMRDIYEKANRVYLWLGKGNKHSDYAIDWIVDATCDKSLATNIRLPPFPEALKPSHTFKVLRLIPKLARRIIYCLRRKNRRLRYDHEAMKDLISRNWFTRVWTIQEVVMANEAIVICGTKTVIWTHLVLGIISANNIADEKHAQDFYDILDSVLFVHFIWTDLSLGILWSEAPIRKWLLRRASTDSSTVQKRFLDFMEHYGDWIATAQIFLLVLAISFRAYLGLRPLKSWSLVVLIFLATTTMLLTPPSTFKVRESFLRSLLVNLLNKTRTRKATKQVDRVFVLYGVFDKYRIPLNKPDYGKPVGQVYTEFTGIMIKWHESLNILTEASAPGLPGAPSWVPDWSRPYHRMTREIMKASGDSLPEFSFSNCGLQINTSSVVVDTVMFHTELLQEITDSPFSNETATLNTSFLSLHLQNIRTLVQWLSRIHRIEGEGMKKSTPEALFEVMHSDTDFTKKDKFKVREIFNKWFSFMTADYTNCITICSSEIGCALALSTSDELNNYYHERSQAIAGRAVLFATANGHIGKGPPSLLAGDSVALLSGVDIPIILRATGPYHRVIGSAYIHGLMQGEAWPQDRATLQQITLA